MCKQGVICRVSWAYMLHRPICGVFKYNAKSSTNTVDVELSVYYFVKVYYVIATLYRSHSNHPHPG